MIVCKCTKFSKLSQRMTSMGWLWPSLNVLLQMEGWSSRSEAHKLKALMHWIQDFYCCLDEPTFNKLTQDALHTEADRAKAHQNIKHNDSLALMPKKFISDKQWVIFYKAIKVYLSTILGVNSVPLIHII